jgi:hypothetical protein
MLDDEAHDFVGPRPDHHQSRITQHSFDGVDIGVADPAQDLHGVIDHLPRRLGRELLALAHIAAHPARLVARIDQARRCRGQGAGGVEAGEGLGHLE